jgi:hypothetical protein
MSLRPVRFALALGILAVMTFPDTRVGGAAAFVGVVIGLLWAAFFTSRWIIRGFLHERVPPRVRRPVRIGWKTVEDWSVMGIVGAALAYLGGVVLWALLESLRPRRPPDRQRSCPARARGTIAPS